MRRYLKFLQEVDQMNDNVLKKQSVQRSFYQKESTILRSRRQVGSLQDYDIKSRIGKGAYGEVYLALKRKTSEYIALKKISKMNLHVKNQVGTAEKEKDVLIDISSQWLVNLLYVFQDSENIYFAMVGNFIIIKKKINNFGNFRIIIIIIIIIKKL